MLDHMNNTFRNTVFKISVDVALIRLERLTLNSREKVTQWIQNKAKKILIAIILVEGTAPSDSW